MPTLLSLSQRLRRAAARPSPPLFNFHLPLLSILLVLLCFLHLPAHSHCSASPSPPCAPRLVQSMRSRRAFFVSCECAASASPTRQSTVRFYAYRLLPDGWVSNERVNRFLRCYFQRRNARALAHACTPASSRWRFDAVVTLVLFTCMSQAESQRPGNTQTPYRFSTAHCSAQYVTAVADARPSTPIDNAINCQCAQRGKWPYTVTIGSHGYLISRVRNIRQEFLAVRQCLTSSLPHLTAACKRQDPHFAVLAAHWFETCCKRARVLLPSRKLACQRIVPDDVVTLLG